MWRNFFLVLVFFIVAQTASAQEISIIKPQESAEITWQLPQAERLIENNSTEISSSAMFFDEQPAETANLPRITFASPLIFADHRQTQPNYVLAIEFFAASLAASLYQHLANPPIKICWYEVLSHNSHAFRLSGWKDGNLLYVSLDLQSS